MPSSFAIAIALGWTEWAEDERDDALSCPPLFPILLLCQVVDNDAPELDGLNLVFGCGSCVPWTATSLWPTQRLTSNDKSRSYSGSAVISVTSSVSSELNHSSSCGLRAFCVSVAPCGVLRVVARRIQSAERGSMTGKSVPEWAVRCIIRMWAMQHCKSSTEHSTVSLKSFSRFEKFRDTLVNYMQS